MRAHDASSDTASRPWPGTVTATVGMTERGFVLGEDIVLAKVAAAGALDTDRIVAMLSVAAVLPPIEEAAALWRRGEKALANLRLAFAGLPRLTDPAMARRLAMAEQVLDHGLPPATLMKELWSDAATNALRKYNPDQPRVPAGSGRESGEWTLGDASPAGGTIRYRDGRIVVAREDEPPERDLPEPRHDQTEHDATAPSTEDGPHRSNLLDPLTRLPGGIGPGPFARRSIPAGPGLRPTPAQRLEVDGIGRETGCHTCGTKNPGTKSGTFYCDHQPPTSLNSLGSLQFYLPHCDKCCAAQGGRITEFKFDQR